jgi:single-stranded-DNA-specific exonuclease
VTGSVILTTVLTDLGYQVFSYIPHRDREGYGLNKSAVDKIVADRADLIISVDCGISNYEEVSLAKEKYGIDMIIVDHHDEPAKLPPAVAIIHCHLPGEKYPFKSLSGGGTAFKVAQALLREEFFGLNKKDIEMKEKWLLDLVALSTIGDIMPLLGENRTLVKYGLLVLQKTRRLGLLKLYEGANIDAKKINTQVVGWQINPRINAAGRLEHANLAYQLLTTNNVEQAIMMAHLLNQSNIERQAKTEAFFNEAVEKIKANYDQEIPRQALVIRNDDWAAGVLGLVAGRLAKKYNRPVYVFTKVGENVVGSGRSIEGFDVTRLLQQNSELLLKFGGHVGACGLSVSPEKFVLFKERLEKLSASELERQD